MTKTKYIDCPIRRGGKASELWAIAALPYADYDYYISTEGRIWSTYNNRLITGGSGVYGKARRRYTRLDYKRRGEKTSVFLHWIIAMTFLPRQKGKNYVRFKDSNSANIRLANIEWCSGKDLLENAFKNRLRFRGLKVSQDQVLKMKKMLADKRAGKLDMTMKEIAAQFNITDVHLYRIQNGKHWAHVGGIIKQKEVKAKIPMKIIRELRRKHLKGTSTKALAAKYNLSYHHMWKIVTGMHYKQK